MGPYASQPNKNKDTHIGSEFGISFASSEMQGIKKR